MKTVAANLPGRWSLAHPATVRLGVITFEFLRTVSEPISISALVVTAPTQAFEFHGFFFSFSRELTVVIPFFIFLLLFFVLLFFVFFKAIHFVVVFAFRFFAACFALSFSASATFALLLFF